MKTSIQLTQDELKTGANFYNKRIEFLIKLGEVKLSELTNKKISEETYFSITELNTREAQFMDSLNEKYGPGRIDLSNAEYIKE